MHIEYEEFESVEDFFMYLASAAPPMKNTMPINSYKDFVMSFIPLSPSTGETYLMLYAKGSLEPGIYEFDVFSKSYKKVESIERADKAYFISITPKRNTIADEALKNL
ncbi:MAG: hypothetical protein ACW9WZ_01685 [Nitrosopumilus sp.]|jgi:hypothetical protein